VGWIGNVILNEDKRGRGGGSYLVKHLITFLTEKGVKTIGLYAYSERLRFYERLGFKEEFLAYLYTKKQ
jgi:GNAT superfamily N-acetyltransferase